MSSPVEICNEALFSNQKAGGLEPYKGEFLALYREWAAKNGADPNSDVTKAIVGTANYETATICKLTNNQPANVCTASYIQQIEATLPAR